MLRKPFSATSTRQRSTRSGRSTPTLSDADRLAEKRRRTEDLLERRRLREELGDDDFNFDDDPIDNTEEIESIQEDDGFEDMFRQQAARSEASFDEMEADDGA